MSIDWIPSGSTRKISSKEPGNRRLIPTDKVSNIICEYESCAERDLIICADHAPDVCKIQHQPITIKNLDNIGKERKILLIFMLNQFLVLQDENKILLKKPRIIS